LFVKGGVRKRGPFPSCRALGEHKTHNIKKKRELKKSSRREKILISSTADHGGGGGGIRPSPRSWKKGLRGEE